ncbi:MAG: hypothetical protein CL917_16750 [Deltaproteobacteria bacterium]|nr:hypothetical protein [Deltaproteobacteria bacterium]
MPLPRGRDLELTRTQLTEWLSARVLDSRGLRVEDLRGPQDTGFSSDTLLFKMSSGAGTEVVTREMVLRVEPSGDFLVFPEYDVGLQFRMMNSLSETKVPVPRMLWLEESAGPLGKPFYVMERIEGQVPSDNPPYHSEGWIYDLSPDDRGRVWWSGLDALSEVHRLQWDDPIFSFIPQIPSGQSSIQAQLSYWEHFMDWGMDRSRYALLNRGFDWLVANAPPEGPLSICWGDARLSNQMFKDCEAVAVIDWEMVFIGNPVADLAWFITMDRVLTEGIGLDRMPGMPNKLESIERWEKNLSRSADHYAYYEIFAAWRFAAIMARIFLQMKHFGVMPQDADIDRTNMTTPILESLLGQAT